MRRDALSLNRHDAFQHHDHRDDRLPPAKSPGDECPPQSSAWESSVSHTNPPSAATTPSSSTTQKLTHFCGPLSSRHSLSEPAGRHRLTSDALPHATTRRHCLATRPTAAASRCRQASRPLAPRTATTRRTSKPPIGSPHDDADRLFRANRRAFTRIPSSRNDAFQQHDPKAAARQSRTSPIAVTTALRSRGSRTRAFRRIDILPGHRGMMPTAPARDTLPITADPGD
jgi:hypothetical protein